MQRHRTSNRDLETIQDYVEREFTQLKLQLPVLLKDIEIGGGGIDNTVHHSLKRTPTAWFFSPGYPRESAFHVVSYDSQKLIVRATHTCKVSILVY